MIRLDTFSLLVPEEAVRREVSKVWYVENQQTDSETGDVNVVRQAKSSHLPIGVSQLKHKEGGDYILTLSAKTLRDNYLDGINLNTWDKAIQGVDEILDIDTQRLWDLNPKILRLDTTDNINIEQIGYSKADICRSLYASKMNGRFVSKWYESSKKLGIEFAGTQQEKNRIICYDKKLDLLKSTNKDFLKSLSNPIKVLNEAEKTLRFETNHTAFRSIKERFRISQNNLQEVLQSTTPVNHNFLKKVIGSDYQISLFEEIKNYKGDPTAYRLRKGDITIIRELNNDAGQVKKLIKELYGDNNWKYHYYGGKQPIKKLVMEMQMESTEKSGQVTESICRDIMEALRLAV
jgi:hypothetical protein